MARLGTRQEAILREACRRYLRFHRGSPLTKVWTGLGTATEYAPAVKGGYMARIHDPNRRYLCWWRLTEKGAAIVQEWIDSGLTYQIIEQVG